MGTIKSSGLPNIEGTWYSCYEDQNNGGYTATGAISTSSSKDSTYSMEIPSSAASGCVKRTLDASGYNAIYGASDTVQPPSVCLHFLIKYT